MSGENKGFSVFINEERAIEVLEAQDCCNSEGIGGDLSFMFPGIVHSFPKLKEKYSYILEE